MFKKKILSDKEIKKIEKLKVKERRLQKRQILLEMELKPILEELEEIRLATDKIEFD